MERKTRLIMKIATEKTICTYCKKVIQPGEAYYKEEGVGFHLHSLLARNYCKDCYKKYGEEIVFK